jgi:hypothetical protein
MPYDIEKDEGEELEITPPYVQYPLSTKGKEPEYLIEAFSKYWEMDEYPPGFFTSLYDWNNLPDTPIGDSQIQINNTVDEVRGDTPKLSQAESLLRRCYYYASGEDKSDWYVLPGDLMLDIEEYFGL